MLSNNINRLSDSDLFGRSQLFSSKYDMGQAWLHHVLGRIAEHKITRIDELLPWRCAAQAA